MANFATAIQNLLEAAQPYVAILAAAALFIIGILLVIPSDELHRKALHALPAVILGCAIALGAVFIGSWITSSFAF